MSHITTVKAKVRFTDPGALKSALEQFGKVIGGTGSMSVVLTTPLPGITSLSFMQQGTEWQARADQWGQYPEYEALVGRIGQQYSKVLKFITANRLSLVSTVIDEKSNIQIKVRSY